MRTSSYLTSAVPSLLPPSLLHSTTPSNHPLSRGGSGGGVDACAHMSIRLHHVSSLTTQDMPLCASL